MPVLRGREDRTPPETLRLGDPWRVRVVPNLYPAFERQEVVVHTPRHARSLAELDDGELALVAEAWRRRREAVPGRLPPRARQRGSRGGLEPAAHALAARLAARSRRRRRSIASTASAGRLVAERDGLVLACPYASRLPYELVIAPAEPRANAFADELLPAALQLLGEAIRRVHAAAGAAPLNAWLHDSADWHLELLPRLSILAGVELGAGWWINALAPEDAAAALQDVIVGRQYRGHAASREALGLGALFVAGLLLGGAFAVGGGAAQDTTTETTVETTTAPATTESSTTTVQQTTTRRVIVPANDGKRRRRRTARAPRRLGSGCCSERWR